MGNRFSRNPPEIKHELLNEFNEHYFEKVQARNSVYPKQRRRQKRRKKRIFRWQRLQGWESTRSLSSRMITADASREEPIIAAPTAVLSLDTFTISSPASPTTYSDHNQKKEEERRRRRKQMLRQRRKAAIQGWQVKRKGNALQLRLARNRHFQLATSVSASSKATSPITLDSDMSSSQRSAFNPMESPGREELNSEFDSMVSTGMIWVEVTRPVTITAVAMSGSRDTHNNKGPLLLAVGGEDGIVTITEIVDEQHHHHGVSTPSSMGSSSVDSSSFRKFGETLEFPQQGRVRSLGFSPDGQFLAIGSDGCTTTLVRIVQDPDTGSLIDLNVFQQVERVDRVYACRFSPNGEFLAIGGFDGKVGIFRTTALIDGASNPLVTEIYRPGLVFCLDWSPCGTYLAIGGSDKCCAVFDNSWKLVHESHRSTSVQIVQWNPDGTYLAIGDREILILESGSFKTSCEITNTNHDPQQPGTAASNRYRINSLCWSPDDGRYLAVGDTDNACMVIETRGFALVHEVRRHGNVTCIAWGQQTMPNGDCRRYLGIVDETKQLALIKAGAEVDGSVAESDDLSSAASSSQLSTESDWVLREDSFRDMEEAPTTVTPQGLRPQGTITSLAFSRSDKLATSPYLAFAADDCSLTILTTRNWKPVLQMEFAKPILTLAFSNSNNYLALGGDEGVLYVLSVPSRSMVVNTIIGTQILSLSFSKLDERLSVGAADGVLTLLRPDSDWEADGEIEHSEAAILTQDWSCKSLVVGRADGTVNVFETENVFSNFFVPQAEISLKKKIRSVCFGVGGKFLAVGCDGGSLMLFTAKEGWVLCHQRRIGGNIQAIGWSPSGRYLAFAAMNQTAQIVDTSCWAEVGKATRALESIVGSVPSNTSISSIDWSVDGRWVALGSSKGSLYLLSSDDWQLVIPSLDKQP